LYATIDWSYELLREEEQRLLRSLAVFSGGFSLEAAERVCCTQAGEATAQLESFETYEVLDGIASLLDKSLIRQEEHGLDPRYAMLETIREYALMKMVESGQERDIRWKHANYFLGLAEEANDRLQGPEQSVWLERLEKEINNLRSALHWFFQMAENEGDRRKEAANAGLKLASALLRFWDTYGYVSEGRRWLREMLEASETPSKERVDALIGMGWLAMRQSGSSDVRKHYERGLTLARSLGYTAGVARALDGLAYVHQFEGAEDDLVQSLHSESLQLWRKLGDKRGIASALGSLAHRAAARYEFDKATSLFKESLALFQDVEDQREIAGALWNLGQIELRRGRYEESTSLFNESLNIYQDLKDTHGIPTQIRCLAEVERAQGNLETAKTLFEESLKDFRVIGDKSCASIVLMGLGRVALNRGDSDGAVSFLNESLALSTEVGYRYREPEVLTALGLVTLDRGDQDSAVGYFVESLNLAQELDSKEGIAANLEGVAKLFVTQKNFERAAQLFSVASIIRVSLGIPIAPIDQVDQEKWIETILDNLDRASFENAHRKGREMSVEEAIALVMENQN
jgi:tetratricopeptide (TPR) repeat protein